ncbi:Fcf2 pre-rRNA processing-domain-containing protein [Blastocladiella britannica]|nr:Fcf2 pre-rRNA processing-domain-containing protein [Blastocladiella britannica]
MTSPPGKLDLEALLARATASLRFSAQQQQKNDGSLAPTHKTGTAKPAAMAPAAPSASLASVKLLKLDSRISQQTLSEPPRAVIKRALAASTADDALPTRDLKAGKGYTVVERKTDTAGDKWFNLPATEITPEIRNDLIVLKNRDVLDSKRHYKRDRSTALPKFFHVGRIVEAKHEFYSARLTKKQRKNTLVEEILASAERRRALKEKAEKVSFKKGAGKRDWAKELRDRRKKRSAAW